MKMLSFRQFPSKLQTLLTQVHYQKNVSHLRNVRLLSSEVDKAKEAAKSRDDETIFDKIIKKEIPADVIYEDEQFLAFNDIMPQAPVHFLVIPKRKLAMLSDAQPAHEAMLGQLMVVASRLGAERMPNGFRLVINNGVHGCQSVYYIHVHVLGGRQLHWPPG